MSIREDLAAPTSHHPPRRRMWGCVGAVLGALALGFASLLLFAYWFNPFPTPTRDPDAYSQVVRERKSWEPERYAFLPDTIEPRAERVGFYHLPAFMQGGDVTCLRLRLSPQRVAEILRGLEATGARELTPFGEFDSPHCYPSCPDDEGGETAPNEDPVQLPAGFRVFNMGATPEEIAEDWNHNFRAFVAVSVERSEVVWYADRW